MKKKVAIITIIITGIIVWGLTALAVGLNSTQNLAFTQVVKEAGSGSTLVNRNIKPVYFLPVGEECEYEISINGPEEIVTTISISTGSPEAEPIFVTTTSNRTLKTGMLNVGNKEIFVNFKYEPLSELDFDKEYAVRCTLELNSGNYALYNGTMIAIAVLCIIPLGLSAAYLFNLAEKDEKSYDERQMRMRGKAAMNALTIVIITALSLGIISLIYKGYSLNIWESMMIVAFIGIAAFAITADWNDAYMKFKGKRVPSAIAFSIIGLVDIILYISDLYLMFTGTEPQNMAGSLVQGICMLAIGIEMFMKNIKDKKEAAADEES